MFIVYNAVLTLLAVFWVPWMLLRANRRGEPPNWKERCGDYSLEPRKDRQRIWLHAVSVGEVIASRPVLGELRRLLPDYEIVLSVTTSSGHKTAREQVPGLFDHLVYFPIDVVRFQLAAMQHVQPAVVAVMETELWMNFLWAAKVFDARTLLINGRISDRSFKPWLKFFYAPLLANVDRCLMQSQVDKERIMALGAKSADVLGNSKIDQAFEGTGEPSKWRQDLRLPEGKPILVIGSTRGEDEERFVLEALRLVGLEKVVVIHAPRHLERVQDLRKVLESYGVEPALRSAGGGGNYLILDTYGELDQIYAVADVAIIGGGFMNHGGQNLIQPLGRGKPVLHGPHMQNFRDVTEAADRSGAALECATPAVLASELTRLLDSPEERHRMGVAATQFVESHAGASARYAQAIAQEAQTFESREIGAASGALRRP